MNTGVQNHVIRQDSYEIEISIVMWINAFGNGFGFLGLRYLRWNINMLVYVYAKYEKYKEKIFPFSCLHLPIIYKCIF